MFEKLVLFGIGYVLGARAGQERYAELVQTAQRFAGRDDVRMALNVVMGMVEQRVAPLERLRAA